MRNRMRTIFMTIVLAVLCSAPVLALGPVDGEVGAVWWASDYDSTGGSASLSGDGDAPGYRAELWLLHRFGFRASVYSSDLDDLGVESADYTSLDFMWRAFSPSENNFLAIGAGWQEMDLAPVGLDGDTSGVRISLDGRIGLPGPFYLYGTASYLPALDDAPATDPLLGSFENLEGSEVDLGLSWTIVPFVAFRAGYRTQTVDFTRTGFAPLPGQPAEMDGEVESTGYVAGLSFRF